jgi:DNA-directed RNA polymerase subunit RPC12/RpoP
MNYEEKREVEKCLNCGSENLVGPYDYRDAFIRITYFNNVLLKAYVCVDCHHAMLFTRDKHKSKILEEAKKRG